MNILPFVVVSLVTTCAVSIKFRKCFIVKKKNTDSSVKKKKASTRHCSLTKEDIEKLELFLNYSALHL